MVGMLKIMVPSRETQCNRYFMFKAKFVYMVGTSSVGFGPIELKFGGDARNDVPYKGKSGSNCYFMFRAKLVSYRPSEAGQPPASMDIKMDTRQGCRVVH